VKTYRDFDLFKKTFKKYQDKLGLNGYSIYFKHELIESGEFANITVNQGEMVATVRLNSKLGKDDESHKHIALSAKHEAIHLLLFRLEHRASCRCNVSDEEIYEATEELVNKLCNLIP